MKYIEEIINSHPKVDDSDIELTTLQRIFIKVDDKKTKKKLFL